MEKLTPRELDVLQLTAYGLTRTEIGERLFISMNTVRTHRYNIKQKMGVANIIEAVAIGVKEQMITAGRTE